jgi:hypothetical protein
MKKLGPVSARERRAYLARLGSDAKWGRPAEKTARAVWDLLKDQLPYPLPDFLPRSKSKARPSGLEYDQSVLIAKQSFVVALDCAVQAGDRGAMLTQNLLLDALAKSWSVRFRRARRKGARTLYDVRPETAKCVWRDLLDAGIRVETLWDVVAGEWSQQGINPLFLVSRVKGRKHALGWRVEVRADSVTLRAFGGAVQEDRQYRRPGQRRLLFAEDWKPRPRRVRQKVCAERPFNVVNLGPGSESVLALLELTRLKFNVEVFRDDYETIVQYADEHPPSTSPQGRGYRKLRAFVSAYRRVYQETDGIPLEVVERGDDFDDPYRREPMSGYRWIRSRFSRALNRRFHAENFWLDTIHKVFRDRWFGIRVDVPDDEYVVPGPGPHEPPELITTAGGPAHGRFVERDISSSQTQILAVLLGLHELEALATSTRPKFKEWLAQRLWTLHEKTPGGLLADGYTGAADARLVAFVKEHWMRRMYGGELQQIIWDLGKERRTYGPGWRTSRGLRAKREDAMEDGEVVTLPSGIGEAETCAEAFLEALPPWADEVETFLSMCNHLAYVYDQGVVFHDPLDGVEVRWHHAQRGETRLPFGHYKIEVHPPGVNAREVFWPLPPGTVNRRELGQFIPPCLIQMLDAFFSGLVVTGLHAEGVGDVVAVHDGWFVPETFQAAPDGPTLNGQDALDHEGEQQSAAA